MANDACLKFVGAAATTFSTKTSNSSKLSQTWRDGGQQSAETARQVSQDSTLWISRKWRFSELAAVFSNTHPFTTITLEPSSRYFYRENHPAFYVYALHGVVIAYDLENRRVENRLQKTRSCRVAIHAPSAFFCDHWHPLVQVIGMRDICSL